ncbi:MAG: hypothetical protein AB1753_01075, partial [Thermoproteota archaeon]
MSSAAAAIVEIETTPALVSKVYAKLQSNVEKFRKTVSNRPLTLSEKILIGHLDGNGNVYDPERGKSYVF